MYVVGQFIMIVRICSAQRLLCHSAVRTQQVLGHSLTTVSATASRAPGSPCGGGGTRRFCRGEGRLLLRPPTPRRAPSQRSVSVPRAFGTVGGGGGINDENVKDKGAI